jgi:ABC-type branched-subunit amino acid transport system substrate-binding protein
VSFLPLAVHAAEEVLIGVISPDDYRAIGRAHRATIEIAKEDLNNSIRVGNGLRAVRFVSAVDRGRARVADAARALVEEGVVAILGPVDSDSTRAIIDAGLNVPILSALSTAESLTEDRDPWFFRVTLGDRERISRYLAELRRDDGALSDRIPRPRVVIYESSSAYGSGLARELRAQLEDEIDREITWNELVGDNLQNPAGRERVRVGDGFHPEGIRKLHPAPSTVFVLGKSNHSGLIAQGVRTWLQRTPDESPPEPRFVLVGNDGDLRKFAPQGSWTIGEPTITSSEGTAVASLRRRFVQKTDADAGDFVVTAYEAARYVVPEALHYALGHLASGQPLPPPTEIRNRLREALDTRSFSSIEPWRHISFGDGAMRGAPRLPVYQLVSEFRVRATSNQPSYIEVKAPRQIGLLEGPLRFQVIPHAVEHFELHIKRLGTEEDDATLGPYTAPSGAIIDAEYYPTRPGTYVIRSQAPVHPNEPRSFVAPPFAYCFAIVGGLVGSLLVARGSKRRAPMIRVLLGIATGLILTGLHFHRDSIAFATALPQFGESALFAGFWAGVFGGLLGPSALLLALGRTSGDPQDSPPREAPKPETISPVGT